jgi:FAD/FMN-containing dehydrogenase
MKLYRSWGRYPQSNPAQILPLSWASEVPDFNQLSRPVLVYGQGRSYGDCCLNDDGILLDSSGLDRFIQFDKDTGILRCEAGVTLQSVLRLILPAGWFLPVTPGTQFVTVGGAIANDVHGKNHHRAGSFGCHVRRFELLRSDRGKVLCSQDQNTDLFEATIGGLGLTGLILWAEFQLKRVPGPWIDCEQIRFEKLQDFFELSAASDKSHEYTVAWLDCIALGNQRARGIFMRGNHSSAGIHDSAAPHPARSVPGFDAPEILINRLTMAAFNWMYFHRHLRQVARSTVHFEKFFYPLDGITEWNRLYGQRGFLQYQFVVPYEKREAVHEILQLLANSREVCTLSVLKVFGAVRSPGLLSFPRPGVTLAMDFPFRGQPTLDLCEQFDELVRKNGGAVYPAKDARMSSQSFQTYFPRWEEFSSFLDPRFASDFWRRVAVPRQVSQ